jgi:uncharacterized protein
MSRRLLAVLLFIAAAPLFALDIPPKPTQWVNDYGVNLLSAAETQRLDAKLEQLFKRTGTQFLVMIWPSLQGEELRAFTNRVANMWKVKDDKALMLFVFVDDRKTFIQVGYGLEPVITDAYASDVYRNTLVPHFRRRQYYAGIDMAIDRLAARIEPKPAASGRSAVPLRASGQRVAEGPVRGATRDPGYACFEIVIVLLGFGGFLALIIVILRARPNRSGSGSSAVAAWQMPGAETTFTGTHVPPPNVDFSDPGASSVGGSWGGGDSSFGGGGAGGSW